jgi:uncharacterized membrane protein
MPSNRLEAFSDGVLAIIITIMVLELHAPDEATFDALEPLLPTFIAYVLSFAFIGIYWNNHHHLMQAVHHVNGRVLWANMHLLFWLSLIPFGTAWMGTTDFGETPVALYGALLLLAGVAYFLLTRSLLSLHGPDAPLNAAVGSDRKGVVSLVVYAAAVPLALFAPYVAGVLYALVAAIWFIPDRRIERVVAARHEAEHHS